MITSLLLGLKSGFIFTADWSWNGKWTLLHEHNVGKAINVLNLLLYEEINAGKVF